MTGILQEVEHSGLHALHDEEDFKFAVQQGLAKPKKSIPSQYFYNQQGAKLFDQITRHPDYYLTNCEIEILNNYKARLLEYVGDQPFNLIELGPGEGLKTRLLIDYFYKKNKSFTYSPIDIAKDYLQKMVVNFNVQFPSLNVMAVNANFMEGLQFLTLGAHQKNVLLFLGSSIGNCTPAETINFFNTINTFLYPGDYILIGFDLRKDTDILLRAYNDSDGITRDFNLNMLARINEELGGNFNLQAFQHYATYNVYSGAMESYLISKFDQSVKISALQREINFTNMEPIHLEYSHKFTLPQIEALAQMTNFAVEQHFLDDKSYFVDSLWRVK